MCAMKWNYYQHLVFRICDLHKLWKRISLEMLFFAPFYSSFLILHSFSSSISFWEEKQKYIFVVVFLGQKGIKISTQQNEWLTQSLVNQQNVRMCQMLYHRKWWCMCVCVCVSFVLFDGHAFKESIIYIIPTYRQSSAKEMEREVHLQFYGKNRIYIWTRQSWFVHKIYLPI